MMSGIKSTNCFFWSGVNSSNMSMMCSAVCRVASVQGYGLTYGEVKRVLWQLIHEFKRKEEKYLNESSIT